MTKKHTILFLIILLNLCSLSDAADLPHVVWVTITENGQDLQADVSGSFMFPGIVFSLPDNLPDNFTELPVPPDANNIEITESGSVSWTWSANEYETLYLPEEPNWPMVQWNLVRFPGPTYPITITYCVDYEHTLIKRTGEFIFFYANESFEFWSKIDYPNGLFSAIDFTISFPEGYSIKGVWSRDIPLTFQVSDNELTFSVDDSCADRITVAIRPPCTYTLAGDLNDDCAVDFKDFAVVANNWLIDCIEDPGNPSCVPK